MFIFHSEEAEKSGKGDGRVKLFWQFTGSVLLGDSFLRKERIFSQKKMPEKSLDNQDVGKNGFLGKKGQNPRGNGKNGKSIVNFCTILLKRIDKK